jgi:ADP-ribose pyrophosphatase
MGSHHDFRPIDQRILSDGFLKVIERQFEYRKRDGQMSGPLKREVMIRRDAAAILLYHEDLKSVVLVRQFRIATVRDDLPGGGWPIELPAGVIENHEQPIDCARREAGEETGLRPTDCRHIATIYPSPGGSSERIFIYFAKVTEQHRIGNGGGTGEEDIQPFTVSLPALWGMLERGEIQDAKLLAAAQWLRLNPPVSPDQPLKLGTIEYQFVSDLQSEGLTPRVIGIKTGGIDGIRGVDAWVNAENTDMMMARIFESSISARIRHLGAAKNLDNTVHADTIANALQRKLAGQTVVKAGKVIVTTSGELRHTHGVKCILHVACVDHQPGGVVSVSPRAAASGLANALVEADHRNWFWWRHMRRHSPLRSILVPLIGEGNGGAPLDVVVRELVPVAFNHLDQRHDGVLRAVYFIAFKARHREAIEEVLKSYVDLGLLQKA